ncbi:MarR family winged helix-turn-helix transcriptional regulator [Aneurinibacillus terranovensis]|uniref:MarR family winged helix-turn-helix transcriptional regulator n=1 Tax=Aneurinibacillus terranovensis TaxID=278991 RepID=UPI001FE1D2F5|nr:MarR family transcriptional regulator [Aneurinibacillus terranovensis]
MNASVNTSLNSSQSNESIGFFMGRTYRKLTHLLFQRFKEYDITPEQWVILHRLSQQDGINQKEIAIRTAKDQPTTTRILDVLYKKALIQKQMSETDRRAFLVYLTDKGKALVEQTIPIEKSTLEEAVRGIEPAELELFKTLISQIDQNITNMMRGLV